MLISPYFTPSNLAGVQRVRLLSSRLQEFNWIPTVVCVDPDLYEEAHDQASLALLPEGLHVERVGAWPARICRPLGVGDVSLRGQGALRRCVADLVQRLPVDLIFCTVLPGYTCLVGAWARRRFGTPFVLDYQDPWVSDWGARQPLFSKAGLAHWLATKLEPGAVRVCDALTAVSDETLSPLRERRLVRHGLPVQTIPIGSEIQDHAVAARFGKSSMPPSTGTSSRDAACPRESQPNVLRLAYLGTIVEGMLPTVRTLFRAVASLGRENPDRGVEVHFIGTSAQPSGSDRWSLKKLAADAGLGGAFHLEPRRIGYLDALRTMQDADVLLLLGSQDEHYTASKLFPCWLADKPLLAVFHAASTVNTLAQELGGVRVVSYDHQGPELHVAEVQRALREFQTLGRAAVPARNPTAFEPYSARGVARRFAALFDAVIANRQN